MKSVCRPCDTEQAPPATFEDAPAPCFNCGEPTDLVPGMTWPGPYQRLVAMTTADLLAL